MAKPTFVFLDTALRKIYTAIKKIRPICVPKNRWGARRRSWISSPSLSLHLLLKFTRFRSPKFPKSFRIRPQKLSLATNFLLCFHLTSHLPCFQENRRPTKEQQLSISSQLGLEVSTVSNFFMNARRRSMDKWSEAEFAKNGHFLGLPHGSPESSPTSSCASGMSPFEPSSQVTNATYSSVHGPLVSHNQPAASSPGAYSLHPLVKTENTYQ